MILALLKILVQVRILIRQNQVSAHFTQVRETIDPMGRGGRRHSSMSEKKINPYGSSLDREFICAAIQEKIERESGRRNKTCEK